MAGTPAQKGYNEAGNTDSSRKTVELCGWATPQARDWKGGDVSDKTLEKNARPLNEQAVMLAGWATPNTMDHLPSSNLQERKTKGGCCNLKDQISALSFGPPATGSPASTERRGQLNPAFSRWLMGFPPAWDDYAPTATRSSRKPRRPSCGER
jgi:hypothetical protein